MTGKSFTANARGLAWVCTTAACLLSAAGARGEESPDQRLADALLQEGTLLQQEVLKLQPTGVELERERKRLTAEEAEISREASEVTRSFQQFNATADELNVAMQKQREECEAGHSQFQSEVDACNSRAEALRTQGAELGAKGTDLDLRQDAVNKRIVEHNAAGREWNARSNAHQQKWMPSIQQVQAWLGRFKEFVDSESYPQFVAAAGNPADCAQERVGALNPQDSLPSLGRALQCLKGLKAASR